MQWGFGMPVVEFETLDKGTIEQSGSGAAESMGPSEDGARSHGFDFENGLGSSFRPGYMGSNEATSKAIEGYELCAVLDVEGNVPKLQSDSPVAHFPSMPIWVGDRLVA